MSDPQRQPAQPRPAGITDDGPVISSLPLPVPVELLLAPDVKSPLTVECCLILMIFSSILRYIPFGVRMTKTF